jgi:hypothetical protein
MESVVESVASVGVEELDVFSPEDSLVDSAVLDVLEFEDEFPSELSTFSSFAAQAKASEEPARSAQMERTFRRSSAVMR